MILTEFKTTDAWVQTRWQLTYPTGWEDILRMVHRVYDYYTNPELIAMLTPLNIKEKDEILSIPENMKLTLRGASTILKTPISITFYNQIKEVQVTVARMTKEFKDVDYRSLCLSLGQYLDSIEIARYTK